MEIIHLILGKANPDRMNGVNKVVYQLATKQKETGRDVSVWGITKDLTHNYGKRNFKTVLFPAKRNPFQMDNSLKKAILSMKDKAVFHLHGGWIPLYYSAVKFMSMNNIQMVITPHGNYNSVSMQRSNLKKRVYFRLFEKTVLKKVNKVHSLGESEVEGLMKLYPNNKSFLFPYGFDVDENKVIETKKTSTFVIGYMGRLDIFHKGLDILINAYEKFLKKVPDSQLWIIGDGEGRHELESMVKKLGLQENVLFLGGKFGEEKEEIMRKFDIFTHSSRMEGMPTSVIEASNLGIPSVVTKATNIGSYLTTMNAGLSVEDEDPEGLVMAFNRMYKLKLNNTLEELGSNAAGMVKAVFDWDVALNKFDSLYS